MKTYKSVYDWISLIQCLEGIIFKFDPENVNSLKNLYKLIEESMLALPLIPSDCYPVISWKSNFALWIK